MNKYTYEYCNRNITNFKEYESIIENLIEVHYSEFIENVDETFGEIVKNEYTNVESLRYYRSNADNIDAYIFVSGDVWYIFKPCTFNVDELREKINNLITLISYRDIGDTIMSNIISCKIHGLNTVKEFLCSEYECNESYKNVEKLLHSIQTFNLSMIGDYEVFYDKGSRNFVGEGCLKTDYGSYFEPPTCSMELCVENKSEFGVEISIMFEIFNLLLKDLKEEVEHRESLFR